MFAVVITGPPGAGKTSVLTALVDALTDDDVAHVAIELETLAWTHPALDDVAWSAHIEATCALPANWSGLADLVEHTQVLAATMPSLRGVDLVVGTEGQRPEAVAARIRAALPGQVAVPGSAKGWK